MRIVHGLVLLAALSAWSRADDAPPAPPPAAPPYEGRTAAEWGAQLDSDDVKLRQKAAYALFKLGPDTKGAAVALVAALGDADEYVRTTAAKAIPRLPTDDVRAALPALAAWMFDDREAVRREAASLLWRLGPLAAHVVPELAKALASDDPSVRANVAASLGNAGPAAKSALPALGKALGDRDDNVRRWATKALVEIDVAAASASERPEVRLAVFEKWSDPSNRGWTKPEIVALVLRGIGDPDENVRGWATHTLDTFAAFAGDARPPEWIAVFRRVLEKEPLPATRAAAAFGLGRYTSQSAEVLPALLASVKSREPEVKRGVLLALGLFGASARAAVPAALDALRDEDPQTRQTAAYALGAFGDGADPVIAALIGALRDESSSVRRNAVSSLAILGKGTTRAAQALVVCLEDETSSVFLHESAAHALADVAVPEVAIPALTRAFEKDPAASPNVARSLVALDAPLAGKALDRLIEGMGSSDDPTRELILLGQLGAKAARAVPAICKILDGTDKFRRLSAADALAKIGLAAKDALPALERGARDADADVAQSCTRALDAIRTPGEGPPK